MFIERFTLVLLMPPILIIEVPRGERIHAISVSFLFRTFTYTLLHLLPFEAFLAAECNYACSFQCGCSVCLALMPLPLSTSQRVGKVRCAWALNPLVSGLDESC